MSSETVTKCNRLSSSTKSKEIGKKPKKPYVKPKFPPHYELVSIFIERLEPDGKKIDKRIRGWWTGREWISLRLRDTDKIIAWERKDSDA